MIRVRSLLVHTALPVFIGAGVSFAAQSAHAACDPETLLCSVSDGPGAGVATSNEDLGSPLSTGWIPRAECGAGDMPHCDESIQFAMDVNLAQKADTPTYSVDLSDDAQLNLSWPNPEDGVFIVELANQTRQSGEFSVVHGMEPRMGFFVSIASFTTGDVWVEPLDLLNAVDGFDEWDYRAEGTTNIAPWGFEEVTVRAQGLGLEVETLYSTTFETLATAVGIDDMGEIAQGTIGIQANTDIVFAYRTTEVLVQGAESTIDSAVGTTEYTMNDNDFLEFRVSAKGVITYGGEGSKLGVGPAITVTRVGGFDVNLEFPIDAYSMDIPEQTIEVTFPPQTVHFPLPNVFVPQTPVDFGSVDTGTTEEETVTIENTGEMDAMVDIRTDNTRFRLSTTSTVIPAGGTLDLVIGFRPTEEGEEAGTITVQTNDPDTPDWEIEVSGEGYGAAVPANNEGGAGGATREGDGGNDNEEDSDSGSGSSGDDGGCGCRAAGQTNAAASLFALLGLAAVGLRRRRRS